MNDEEYRLEMMHRHMQEKRRERERIVKRKKMLLGAVLGAVLLIAVILFVRIKGPKIAADFRAWNEKRIEMREAKKAEKEAAKEAAKRAKNKDTLNGSGEYGADILNGQSGENGSDANGTNSNGENGEASDTGVNGDAAPKDEEISILLSFAGDCEMANDEYESTDYGIRFYEAVNDSSYFFAGAIDYFENDDFTVVNCENVLSDQFLWPTDKGEGVSFWFKAPANVAKIFKDNSIEGVTISNNHTYDYGWDGYNDTREALKAAGVDYGDDDRIMYFEKDGYKISVICVSFYYPEGSGYVYSLLEEAKETSDFQIIYFHGGEEAVETAEDWKIDVCRSFVDEGADLVLGSHPHVLQRREKYNGANIVYSLGNFCFGGNSYPAINRTIVYQLKLNILKKTDGTFELTDSEEKMIPFYVYTGESNNYQPYPIEEEALKEEVLMFMEGEIDSLR